MFNGTLFVLGGAKIATKLPMITKFESLYDHILIGGALYNTILKAQNKEIGVSKADELDEETLLSLQDVLSSSKLLLPTHVICETSDKIVEKNIENITTEDNILDISETYIGEIDEIIAHSKTILWNGPLGFYEGGFTSGTDALAKIITSNHNFTVIGGGDTASAVKTVKNQDAFDFVSTGGGSMINYLSSNRLPALDALI